MLDNEIENAQRLVKTDAYQMSIGEIISMYKEGELVINPDFQRLFRWEIGQKSKLIESLLLGIPIPSIFVFEREDATWELIDGLQRISTLLEFMGLLKESPSGKILPPSCLVATKYLPSLFNAVWEKSKTISEVSLKDQVPLDSKFQLAIRRARMSVEILKRPSDNATKYDLFQRLNAGGSVANAQELRNCLVIMINNKYSNFMKICSSDKNFLNVLAASDDQLEKQKHMEYVSRFLVHTYIDFNNKLDVEEFIDDGIITLAEGGEIASAKSTFIETFRILNQCFGDNALRRISNGHSTGKVTLVALEAIAVGISRNLDNVLSKPDSQKYVKDRVRAFWKDESISKFFSLGQRGTSRIQKTVPFGQSWFAT
jgi:Protein of unknown function DUF262